MSMSDAEELVDAEPEPLPLVAAPAAAHASSPVNVGTGQLGARMRISYRGSRVTTGGRGDSDAGPRGWNDSPHSALVEAALPPLEAEPLDPPPEPPMPEVLLVLAVLPSLAQPAEEAAPPLRFPFSASASHSCVVQSTFLFCDKRVGLATTYGFGFGAA